MISLIKKYQDISGESQSSIARELGTTQQTLSRWMRGVSSPKDTSSIIAKLKEMIELAESPNRSTELLPLMSLQWEKFEKFCARIFSETEGFSFLGYGVKGDSQKGIDLYSAPTLPDGYSDIVVQCKCQSGFGLQKVENAIDLYEKHGRNDRRKIIAVATNVGTKVRDQAIARGWEIVDKNDLNNLFHSIKDINVQRSIIRQFFPGRPDIMNNCLGIRANSRIIDANDYFKDLEAEGPMFDMSGKYISNGEVNELAKLINDSKNTGLLLVHGDAGVGKTRFVMELCKKIKLRPMVLQRGETPTLEDVSSLDERHVLIIDDAHLNPSTILATTDLLAKIALSKRPFVIITTRTYSHRAILRNIHECLIENVKQYVVKQLNYADSKKLVESITPPSAITYDLIRASKGLPLLLSVGAKAIKEKKIRPSLLLSDDNAKNILGRMFESIIRDATSNMADKTQVREFIQILSLLQPMPNQRKVLEAIGDFIGINQGSTRTLIRTLKEYGIIREYSDELRISPDLLGDYLCECAVFPTGNLNINLLDDLFDYFDADLISKAIINVCHLEWRNRSSQDKHIDEAINYVWRKLSMNLTANDRSQIAIEKILPAVAYYQPERSLEIINEIIYGRGDKQINPDIMAILPSCLEATAYTESTIPKAVEYLISIMHYEKDNQWQSGTSPMEILKRIISYDLYKPVSFNNVVASSLIELNNKYTLSFNILDLLDKVLATHGSTSYQSAPTSITYQQFTVNSKTTKAVRKKVIDLIFAELSNEDESRAIRAAKSLKIELQEISGKKAWDAERKLVYEKIALWLNEAEHNPAVFAEVCISSLPSLAKDPDASNIVQLFEKRMTDIRVKIALAIVDAYGTNLLDYKDKKERREWIELVVNETLKSYDGKEAELMDYICEVADVSGGSSCLLIDWLSAKSKDFCLCLISHILNHGVWTKAVVDSLSNAIGHLLVEHKEANEAIRLSSQLLSMDDSKISSSVAFFIVSNHEKINTKQRDDLVNKLLQLGDDEVYEGMIRALHYARPGDPIIHSLISTICKIESQDIISSLLELLNPSYGLIDINAISEEVKSNILKNLTPKAEIGYPELVFLNELSKTNPQLVISFFEGRIEYLNKQNTRTEHYSPIPYFVKLSIDAQLTEESLDQIILWMNEVETLPSWYYYAVIPDLLKAVNASTESITSRIQNLLMRLNGENLNTLRSLISTLPETILWDNPSIVEQILDVVKLKEPEHLDAIEFCFYRIATTGDYSRAIGSPSEKDLRLKEKTKKVLYGLKPYSSARKLYLSIQKSAENGILSSAKRDEDLMGGML